MIVNQINSSGDIGSLSDIGTGAVGILQPFALPDASELLDQWHSEALGCRCAACCAVGTADLAATPENTTFVSDFTALLSGSSMSTGAGTGAFFTFSFPETPPAYLSDFYTAEQIATFEEFAEAYKQVARTAVEAFTSISGLTGFEVSAGQGDVQFMIFDLAAFPGFESSAGFAYYPGRSNIASDIFIDRDSTSNSTNIYLLLHELGHAFGLKHPFEGDVRLADEFDNQAITVMSYNFGQFDGGLGDFDEDAIINLYGDASADGNQIASWSWDQVTETLTQTGGATGETIYGVGGNNIINGGGGNDTLWGRSGDDILNGGDGDDTLNGGEGSDQLIGGNGNDNATLRVREAGTVFSFDGGAGTDRVTIFYEQEMALQIATSQLGLTSVERLTLYGTDSGDEITIDTNFDFAFVIGGGGDDILRAGQGQSQLQGGDGDDLIFAGTGFGFMFGGNGTDRFIFTGNEVSNNNARDQIEDFETGIDTVELNGFAVDDIIINPGSNGSSFVTIKSSDGDVLIFVRDAISLSDFGLGVTGTAGRDELTGLAGSDRLFGADGGDLLNGGLGNDILDGGSNVDTAIVSGNRASYTVNQISTGVFEVTGADGTDTLSNIEFLQFDDEILRLFPGAGIAVNFETADPSVYAGAMENIRDFDGNDLGGNGSWLRIGSADVNGDGDVDQILVNDAIGRFATVGTAGDGLVYFDDHGWAGETRVAGIYIDPLVQSGDVVAGSANDSQRRFQNDLQIENINRVLGSDDYDGDGIFEVYFALTDGTAYLRALMHEDGNIRYANYQSEQEVIDYLTANGYDASTYGSWFTPPSGGPQAAPKPEAFIGGDGEMPAGMPVGTPDIHQHLTPEMYG